jgi:hypothetical protein
VVETAAGGARGGRPKFDLESLRGAQKALEMPGMPGEARELLPMVNASLREAEPILLVESNLRAGDLPEALVSHLPESLRAQFKSVRGLQKIGIELNKPGGSADIEALTGALKDVHSDNPRLATRVRDAAAVAAERKGQPGLAGRLRNIELIPSGPPADPPIQGGVADLPPPHAPGTSQAGQKESVLKGLDDLGPEVRAEAQGAERKLTRDLERWADFRFTMGHGYYQLYRLASNQSGESDDDPQKAARRRQERKQCLLRAEGILGRLLRPSERLLVADMVARGYKDEQIVAELRDLDQQEDQP